MRHPRGEREYKSDDSDTERIWRNDTGVHQNLTFAVQPDPISGMQCWHQRVTVTPAESGDQCGDVVVDTNKSREAYLDWLSKTRPPRAPAACAATGGEANYRRGVRDVVVRPAANGEGCIAILLGSNDINSCQLFRIADADRYREAVVAAAESAEDIEQVEYWSTLLPE